MPPTMEMTTSIVCGSGEQFWEISESSFNFQSLVSTLRTQFQLSEHTFNFQSPISTFTVQFQKWSTTFTSSNPNVFFWPNLGTLNLVESVQELNILKQTVSSQEEENILAAFNIYHLIDNCCWGNSNEIQAGWWVGRCALWDGEGFCLSETDLRSDLISFIFVRNWFGKI